MGSKEKTNNPNRPVSVLLVSNKKYYPVKNCVRSLTIAFQGIATGKYHAAHLTNDEEWESKCREAGQASGDLSFPLVYCPELHFVEFLSAVADMKNSVAVRFGVSYSLLYALL